MPTISDTALTDAVTKALRSDPHWGIVLSDVLTKMRSGYYDQWWIDCVTQSVGYRRNYQLEDALAFAQVWTGIHTGKIAACPISIGGVPQGDKSREYNDLAIRNTMHRPFTGRFYGGAGDNDGYIEWDEKINLLLNYTDKGESVEIDIEPGSCALEVGDTRPSVTILHLASERRLARWCYGYEKVGLFIMIDKHYLNPSNLMKRAWFRGSKVGGA